MKNRKAKILLVRRNAPGVWQWVRLSNRRMGLMIPISPLILVWIIGKIIEPVIELYNDVVWASFNTLHNKINPYKES
ncbi:DUF4014 family protein [Escherichia coli]|uniref:DUF4014 family protein n=1 Tax=Escherichia coli TaxID=562 RepID=UPI00207CD5AD|nr:DUF4014 family protein [Escherichia coli]